MEQSASVRYYTSVHAFANTNVGRSFKIMLFDKNKLEAMSISDLKAIRDYSLYQYEHRKMGNKQNGLISV